MLRRGNAHPLAGTPRVVRPPGRRGITLWELLVAISIVAILAGLALGMMYIAQTDAKIMKTRAMISKLNNLILPRYEAYRTRRVPIQFLQPPVSSVDSMYNVYPRVCARRGSTPCTS